MAATDGTGDRQSRRRRGAIAVSLLAAAIFFGIAFFCFYTVGADEYALIIEFGKPVRVVTAPGLGVKYPYQSVRSFDNRLFAFAPASAEFLTIEKTPVVAASTILWRIRDPKRFFETVFDRLGAESRLGDILFAEFGAAIGRNGLSAFSSDQIGAYRAEAILAEVAAKCRELALRDYGIDVVDVRLRAFDFAKQNRGPVYARMKSERGRLSMKYRSEGEEEGLKIRAAADQEKSKILAEASKLAQQYRGEGESQAARVYAQALSKGPQFYEFVRTMEASRHLLPKGSTVVLPVNSELFGLLSNSAYYNRSDASQRAHHRSKKE
ncbi:MAG TPA: protease modulator HflC [Burkholderiales bacterium]|nr:protease modulator HflC [Burkholderiales bacterium]